MSGIYDPSRPNQFSAVDSSGKADEFVDYLKTLSTEEFVSEYVRESLRGLQLSEGKAHLEVGCGIAHDLELLQGSVGESGNVALLDNSEEMLGRARKCAGSMPNVSFHLVDAHHLPFPDNSFDSVRIVRVLQHVVYPQGVVNEIARVLKPGGRLCAVEPNWLLTQIEGCDKAVLKDFLGDLHVSIRNAGIGGALTTLATEAGLCVQESRVLTWRFTSLEEAKKVITFKARIEKLQKNSSLPWKQYEDWLSDLESRSVRGEFSASVHLGFVVGQK